MQPLDYPYLCGAIGRLSSVPVRIYERGEKAFFQTITPLPVDPIRPYEGRILADPGPVGYLITEDFDFYGIVRSGEATIVLGPSRQIPRTQAELNRLAFDLEVPKADIPQFTASLSAIIPLPLDFMLEILCMVHYMASGEKLQLRDLRVTDLEQAVLGQQTAEEQARETYEEPPAQAVADVYSAYRVEQELLSIVGSGDLEQLDAWVSQVPPVKSGRIAADTLSQEKSVFTVCTTLVSRAAVQGGMDVEDAMRLSDSYIRKCQRLSSLGAIANLQLAMIRYYTGQVAHIRGCGARSDLAREVVSYVRHHLSEAIRTEDIAQALHLSRSYLSTRFKKEQGADLTDFIQAVKVNEAKYLLRYTDRSLLTISDYLGFSSQSHFSRVFKAQTGLAPGNFRKQGR